MLWAAVYTYVFALRKHAYSNILKISPPQPWKFSDEKNLDIFHISAQNIDCGHSLEPPHPDGSNGYPQSMFLSRNKKNNVYPCKLQFYYIKVWFKGGGGGQNYIGMFSWWQTHTYAHTHTRALVSTRTSSYTGGGLGGLVTLDLVQTCGWNFYDPTYLYNLQISKYLPFHIFVCEKGSYLRSYILLWYYNKIIQ